MRFLTLSLAAAATALLLGAEAAPCDTAKCQFPACVCPSVNPPKGLDPKTVPQFFTLTFDDAIQSQTVPVTSTLMTPHRNPNGCPIKATWFAQTLYSDYSLIQQWYAAGNEVADHTMNHIGIPPLEEITGNRKAINAFSGVPFANLNGFRAPFLNYSKATFDSLAQEKFLYDSSASAIPGNDYWPYTLDYGLANDCWTGICDAGVVAPNMWEIPMHAIMDDSNPPKAYSMDAHLSGTPDAVGTWLRNNFNRHYQGTRQPFGIFLHPVHVGNASDLYNEFFAWALAQKDVWFVTNHQLLEWMKNPVPASQLASQPYMKCNQPAVGKEICNGLDNLKAGGKINAKLLETCNFPSGPWSTCYGCPKNPPTPADPVPERVMAAGVAGARTAVPTTCAMEWWDPVAAQCLCSSSNCTFTDISIMPTTTSSTAKPTGTAKPNDPKGAANALTGSWTALGAAAAAAAAIAMQMF